MKHMTILFGSQISAGLDYIQLHGDESSEFCKSFHFQSLRPFRSEKIGLTCKLLDLNVIFLGG